MGVLGTRGSLVLRVALGPALPPASPASPSATATVPATGRIIGPDHADLHAAAEHADVADDDAIALADAGANFRLSRPLVDDAQLHRRDVHRVVSDAVDI